VPAAAAGVSSTTPPNVTRPSSTWTSTFAPAMPESITSCVTMSRMSCWSAASASREAAVGATELSTVVPVTLRLLSYRLNADWALASGGRTRKATGERAGQQEFRFHGHLLHD
jgi:hypothetical protein